MFDFLDLEQNLNTPIAEILKNENVQISAIKPRILEKNITELTEQEKKIILAYDLKENSSLDSKIKSFIFKNEPLQAEDLEKINFIYEEKFLSKDENLIADEINTNRIFIEFSGASQENLKTIYFTLNKKVLADTEKVKLVLSKLKEIGGNNTVINLAIYSDMSTESGDGKVSYIYNKDEIHSLVKIYNELDKLKNNSQMKITEFKKPEKIYEFDTGWTLIDVLRANDSIFKLVDKIKQMNFSPFETMIYIHNYVTKTFGYNEGELEESRVLPGAFKNKKIVCSGFASLVKAIVDGLGDENLKCDLVSCKLTEKKSGETESHCHNLIKIKDEKYGINGVYVEDSCWDCKTEKLNGRGLTHCLYPVSDLMHISGKNYSQASADTMEEMVIQTDIVKEMVKFSESIEKGEAFEKIKEESERCSEIVEKFQNESVPIPAEKFMNGSMAIYTALGLSSSEAKDLVKSEIYKTVVFAENLFDDKSSSDFVVDSKKIKKILKINDNQI